LKAERKVLIVRENLQFAWSHQKSYADDRRRDLSFEVDDFVYLKVRGKLALRFIGPYKILVRIGEVAYRLELQPQLTDVHDVFYVS
jgi:hypothetical protein